MKMKRIYIVGALAGLLCIGSCSKPTTINDPVYNDPGKFELEVVGFHDTSLERSDIVNYIINVNKTAGATEKVAFSTYNEPNGMTIEFEKRTGEPSYTTIMSIKTEHAPIGTYPIRVTAASPTIGIQEYSFTVDVTGYSNEATAFIGDFNETGNCAQAGGHTTRIEAVAGVNNRINIKGFWQGTFTNEVYADLIPSNKTIVVPSQTQNGLTFQGSGTYKDDELTINYTVTGNLVNDNCSSTFIRL